MSRIGKKPITIPKGVTVNIQDAQLEIKGAKGVLKTPIPEGITFKLEGESLVAERSSNDQAALHGLARALANNAIQGVTEGFSKQMDIVGVGYKADVQAKKIVFSLGYSHPIEFPLPDDQGRRQLIRLYACGLALTDEVVETVVKKTKNASAAFIKELMRRCAQYYLQNGKAGNLGSQALDAALEEMLFTGGSLNAKLLGASAVERWNAT